MQMFYSRYLCVGDSRKSVSEDIMTGTEIRIWNLSVIVYAYSYRENRGKDLGDFYLLT